MNFKAMTFGALALSFMAAPAMAGNSVEDRQAQMRDRMIEALDTDDNGEISLEEFQAANLQKFEAIDANGDQALTEEEMKQFHDKMTQQMQQRRQQMQQQGGESQ